MQQIGKKCTEFLLEFPPQHQDRQPGFEYVMQPLPIFDNPNYHGSGKLKDKVALITGGDSGLGRAVAVYFAKEGAKVVISYLDEVKDAKDTVDYIRSFGGVCCAIQSDVARSCACKQLVFFLLILYPCIVD